MRYIHEKEITHGYLKSSRILLTSSLTAKIGSFSSVNLVDSVTQSIADILAPEVHSIPLQ